MEIYTAFIRAINVSGTGKISKSELLEICEQCGFTKAKTYIQSGNLVFCSSNNENEVKTKSENALYEKLGKHHEVYVRKISAIENILFVNPFKTCAPNRVIVYFHDERIPDITKGIKHQKDEEIFSSDCETYIHYGEGMAGSKLIVPALKLATGRNINTIEKVLAIAKAVI